MVEYVFLGRDEIKGKNVICKDEVFKVYEESPRSLNEPVFIKSSVLYNPKCAKQNI